MNPYLTHLISDLRQAAQHLPSPPFLDITEEEGFLRGVMEYERAETKPMQEWFGIEKKNFPPADQLNAEEQELMVKEILKLWNAFNFNAVLPDSLPAGIAYKALVDQFDKPATWVSEGTVHIEFCNYDPNECPFPIEFCSCLKHQMENEAEEQDIDSYDNSSEIERLSREISEIEKRGEDEFLPQVDMARYVNQLIGDMKAAAGEAKKGTAKPGSPEVLGAVDTKQLIENPFVTLEELTGITYDMLPEHIQMDGLQNRRLLKAMLELLDAFYLKAHLPPEVPHEIKYEALREEWDVYQVKHLPLSGDDIELCSGDPDTCPFSEFCDCDDEEFEEDEPDNPYSEGFEPDGEDGLPF